MEYSFVGLVDDLAGVAGLYGEIEIASNYSGYFVTLVECQPMIGMVG
jgi:hypothetical protein